MVVLNEVEQIFSAAGHKSYTLAGASPAPEGWLIKRWLMGTHQGAVTPKHLVYYLDEYVFSFNRRLSTHRGKLFYRLMQQAVSTESASRKK